MKLLGNRYVLIVLVLVALFVVATRTTWLSGITPSKPQGEEALSSWERYQLALSGGSQAANEPDPAPPAEPEPAQTDAQPEPGQPVEVSNIFVSYFWVGVLRAGVPVEMTVTASEACIPSGFLGFQKVSTLTFKWTPKEGENNLSHCGQEYRVWVSP